MYEKTHKTAQIRIPVEIHEKLQAIKDRNKCSLHDAIIEMIKAGCDITEFKFEVIGDLNNEADQNNE